MLELEAMGLERVRIELTEQYADQNLRQTNNKTIEAVVVIRVGNNIWTETIMPAGNDVLPLRSNIYAISEHVFESIAPKFGAVVEGGEDYGQGSSREHAALSGDLCEDSEEFFPAYTNRICATAALILSLFDDPKEYDILMEGAVVIIGDIRAMVESRRDKEDICLPAER